MKKTLRVCIDGNWFYPEHHVIVLDLQGFSKQQISDMPEDETIFAIFPDDLDSDKVNAELDRLYTSDYCPACESYDPKSDRETELYMAKLKPEKKE